MRHDFVGEVWVKVDARPDELLLQQVHGAGDLGDDRWVEEFTGRPYSTDALVLPVPRADDDGAGVAPAGDFLPGRVQGEAPVGEHVPLKHPAVTGGRLLGGHEAVPADRHVTPPS